jgi:hypothetical protein
MYLHATYAMAKERQAEFLREAAQQQAQREAVRAAQQPAGGAHAAHRPEETLFGTVKRGLAAVGARLGVL